MSLVQPLFSGKLDIIGDIHGELEALVKLIEHMGYDTNGFHPEGRKLVFVGDLVDRGPYSPRVVYLVKNMIEQGNAQAILGNHEINVLQNKAKDGAGWYFEEQFEKDVNYHPFTIASPEERTIIFDFLSSLPIALENDELRIVHAAWVEEKINEARKIPLGTAAKAYVDLENAIDESITSSGLLERYNEEQRKWAKEQADPTGVLPYLHATCEYNLAHQMNNPLRVLTSGVEQKCENPFYTSGKWRFVERATWWNDYLDEIPVVVGHFWRKLNPNTPVHGENIFEGIEPQSWHGKKNNVFCVDFSVGARFQERNRNQQLGTHTMLAALRWPEKQLILENGEVIPTINFKVDYKEVIVEENKKTKIKI